MDIVTALAVLSPFPVDMQESTLTYQGSFHPRIIPVTSIEPADRKSILSHGTTTDPELPVRIALALNDEQLAWQLLDALPPQHNNSSSLDEHIRNWVQRQLTARNYAIVDLQHIVFQKSIKLNKRDINRAHQSVIDMFSSLQWPLWHGPLLISHDKAASETQLVQRTVLPEIILSTKDLNDLALSQAICRLAMARYQRGQQQLAPWLQVGLAEIIRNKCDGSGPSPRSMLKIRNKAGIPTIRHMFQATKADAIDVKLAKACVAPLVHTRHKHRLHNLFELLINDVSSEAAIKIAYQRDMHSLIGKP